MGLKLDGVTYTYGKGTAFAEAAVRHVDLHLEPGETVLIAGATGSGKSTLLKLAAGLLDPDQGAVTLEGRAMEGPAAGEFGVGLVFQSPETQLFAESVLEDVAFGPRNQGISADDAARIAREALRSVGLDPDEFGPRSPFSLSGGEARRAALAGVLAMQPRYLLLDEPTAGMDAAGRAGVVEMVRALRSRAGIAVVSHDIESFLPAVDRVLVLVDGETSFSGPAEELVADPEVLDSAGLRPPAVLQSQLIAARRGFPIARFTLDVTEAAEMLAGAAGVSR